ncbi:VOC family protein [Nonomuraea sp. SBT364]|uniref:VOC family protein n=1 Tax=Nonomuraea sp. SBT364 TaxID=1580530 RepID=UPI0009E6DC23|nr:VOC family protein [Nonomuraea sp. SBT364]
MASVPGRYRYAAVPHLMVDGAAEAIRFYAEPFGGEELFRIADPEGRIAHAEVRIKGSIIMVGDADGPFKVPGAAGGSTVGLHIYVEDVDALTAQAVRAGAELLQPPADMFYGARSAMLRLICSDRDGTIAPSGSMTPAPGRTPAYSHTE